MAAFGDGYKINKVMVGRGNSTVPYTAYGDDIFHNEGDQIRLECELGFTHDLGKRVMQAECKCDENGACAWEKKTPEWDCISNDNEQVCIWLCLGQKFIFDIQAIPIWGGAVNNFVRRVESKYIVLKARVTNGHKLSDWSHDRVDLVAHPDYSSNDWWGTQPFTMFIWCPFDTRKGGLNPDEGTMTFGDFYPGECSPDGKMCSFLSREGVHAYRSPDANVNAGLAGTAFFKGTLLGLIDQILIQLKGYIDRSETVAEQGPITLVANTPDQWSCETGLLPGHNPVAINNMMNYFEMFKDGDFSTMLSYLRPHKDLPDVEEL